ncbi:MAG: YbaN family protein [Rikenellaceae bacterium]
MKTIFIIIGVISLVLGVVGIFVPLLPTTPFLLLSATLFLHSSPRLYKWLTTQKYLGEYIRNYQENKTIPLKSRITIITIMWVSLLYTIFFLHDATWIRLTLVCIGVGVTWHLSTLGKSEKSDK